MAIRIVHLNVLLLSAMAFLRRKTAGEGPTEGDKWAFRGLKYEAPFPLER